MFEPSAHAEFICMMAEELWPTEWEALDHEAFDCKDRQSVTDALSDLIADHRAELTSLYHKDFAEGQGNLLYPWDQEESSYTQKALHFTYVF